MKLKQTYKFIGFGLILIFFALLFLTSGMGNISVDTNEIVSAIGIDFDGGQYTVTCQTAHKDEKQTSAKNITLHGESVFSAIDSFHTVTGREPKLNFCGLILLGKTVMDNDINSVLEYFSRTARLNDICLVAATTNSAGDLLNIPAVLDKISGFSINQSIAMPRKERTDSVKTSLTDYYVRYYSKSSGIAVPIVTATKNNDDGNLFSAENTAIISGGHFTGELSAKETAIFNLVTDKKTRGNINFTNVNDITSIDLTIQKKRLAVKRYIEHGERCVDLKLTLTVSLADISTGLDDKTKLKNHIADAKVITALQTRLGEDIFALFEKCARSGYDLFDFGESIYKKNIFDYFDYIAENKNYFSQIKPNITVKIKSV